MKNVYKAGPPLPCPYCHRTFLKDLFDDHVRVCKIENERVKESIQRFKDADLSDCQRATAVTSIKNIVKRGRWGYIPIDCKTFQDHVKRPARELFFEPPRYVDQPKRRKRPLTSGLSTPRTQESIFEKAKQEFLELLKHPLFTREERKLGRAYLEGGTHQMIADKLGVTRSAVTKRLPKLFDKMRRIINSEKERGKKYTNAHLLMEFEPRK